MSTKVFIIAIYALITVFVMGVKSANAALIYNVNCDAVAKAIQSQYKVLSEGKSVDEATFKKIIYSRYINGANVDKDKDGFKDPIGLTGNISKIGTDNYVTITLPKSETNKCVVKFTVYNNGSENRYVYWGVDVLRVFNNNPPTLTFGFNKLSNKGPYVAVVQNDLSLDLYNTPYLIGSAPAPSLSL